ncbi:MAG: OmcA/MtrC family decaheme c-type cytochrome [Acidimicrobiia bacterium]|nr:OmcA/MtrC family decaheme c-type cytochrome [Acidimicrobiia bacterium]
MNLRPKFFPSGVPLVRLIVALVAVLTAATLVSAPKNPFTERDKGYYADANLINFVRPGLQVKITAATIAADGTISTRFKLTDPRGLGLDRLGVTTPGTVGISFIAATIPAGQTDYTAYTTRIQTSPITNQSATQAAGENNGTFQQVGDGEYVYTFRARAPANVDRTATHSIGAYASRNLSEFDLGTGYDDDVFNFVPNGAAVRVTRDVIKTASCNNCHDPLAIHGGSRRSMELCVMCHTPQTSDPDTGNTVDMRVMTHKIHMGRDLPSVQAGGKYQIIGFQQSVHDYSKVVFPAAPDTRNCTVCHETGKGAAQEDAWLKPTRAACGSCHDNVNFATGQRHANLPQISDNQCGTCHQPQGELEFDVSIRGAHTDPRFSRDLPGVVFELNEVRNTNPGQRPVVTFTLKDKRGNALTASDMSRLALVLAGPASDYRTFVSENALTATAAAGGRHTYTFTAPVPADAKGTWTIGMEGYRNLTLLAGTVREQTVRDAGDNKVMHFSTDGSPLAVRRRAVSIDKCNACHFDLSLHGGNRNEVEQCVMCHNPTMTDAARRPANQMPAEAIDFKTMIHRIHSGAEQGRPYIIYGFGNTPHDYSNVHYPGDRRNCLGCHINNAEQLPVRPGLGEVTDPRGPLNPAGPTTAACTGCHTTIAAASHALANTTRLGESCAACHGPNATFSINRSHAR